jgi:hypothetical protein
LHGPARRNSAAAAILRRRRGCTNATTAATLATQIGNGILNPFQGPDGNPPNGGAKVTKTIDGIAFKTTTRSLPLGRKCFLTGIQQVKKNYAKGSPCENSLQRNPPPILSKDVSFA